jgi:hypothetical protein
MKRDLTAAIAENTGRKRGRKGTVLGLQGKERNEQRQHPYPLPILFLLCAFSVVSAISAVRSPP